MQLRIGSESDLQALVELVRWLAAHAHLRTDAPGVAPQVSLQIEPGNWARAAEACACHASGGEAPPAVSLLGLVNEQRLAGLDIAGDQVLLAPDAVLTPAARDWLRRRRITVKRSEA